MCRMLGYRAQAVRNHNGRHHLPRLLWNGSGGRKMSEDETDKFCRDCAFYERRPWYWGYHRHRCGLMTDIVTGETNHHGCYYMRGNGDLLCGLGGGEFQERT